MEGYEVQKEKTATVDTLVREHYEPGSRPTLPGLMIKAKDVIERWHEGIDPKKFVVIGRDPKPESEYVTQ